MIVNIIKFLLVVLGIFASVVFGNVFFGDLSVPIETVTESVVIDVN